MIPAPAPALSVVVLSYNGGARIEATLRSLVLQEVDEPYEVVVVDSGPEGAAARLARRFRGVRVVRSERRLLPGAARNVGLRAARGEHVAFLPHDGVPAPGWIAARLARHREGFELVAGAVALDARPRAVALADYIIDFSGLLPNEALLRGQAVPHSLSYARSVFDRFGTFPEDLETGEDTVFNARLVDAGVPVAFEPRATYRVHPPKSVGAYVRHQVAHGRAAIHCAERHGLETKTGPRGQSRVAALYRIVVRQSAGRWLRTLSRLAGARRPLLLLYAALSPLVWLGIGARTWGMWREWLTSRREHVPDATSGDARDLERARAS